MTSSSANQLDTAALTSLDFQYSASLSSGWIPRIRLLELHSAAPDKKQIEITLKDYRFDSSLPAYDALSYAWGKDMVQHEILCNGKKLSIGAVLYQFLWWYSRPENYKVGLLWIDRICSNQLDGPEKSRQVSLMKDIFGRSQTTIAWLGGPNSGENSRIAAGIVALNRLTLTCLDGFLKNRKSKQGDEVLTAVGDWHNVVPKYDRMCIQEVLKKRWFRRVWVVQEVAVSKTVLVQCKDGKADFDVLVLSVMLLAKLVSEHKIFMDEANAINFVHHTELSLMTDLRHCDPGASIRGLPELLAATHRAGAEDIRDKLYSLYGITSTKLWWFGLSSDYTVSARKALTTAIFSLLKSQDNLHLLELAEGVRGSDCPSWCPAHEGPGPFVQNFLGHSVMSQTSLLNAAMKAIYDENQDKWENIKKEDFLNAFSQFKHVIVEERLLNVRMPTLPASQPTRLRLDEEGVLHLDGQVVDKIQEVQRSRVAKPSSWHNEDEFVISLTTFPDTREFARVLIDRDNMVLAREGSRYPNGDSNLTAYRKVVCMGRQILDDAEADNVFDILRGSLAGAKVTTWIERTFGMDLSYGIGTSAALIYGTLSFGNGRSSDIQRTWQLMAYSAFTRLLAFTDKGYLALVPEQTQIGDCVVLLKGGRLPFILRPGKETYTLLGPSYIHGIMDGELSDDKEIEVIKIV